MTEKAIGGLTIPLSFLFFGFHIKRKNILMLLKNIHNAVKVGLLLMKMWIAEIPRKMLTKFLDYVIDFYFHV